MDHLMNMGKKLLKNSMNGGDNHHNNAGFPNHDPNMGYGGVPNGYTNYEPMNFLQTNYGAAGYGPQGYVPQNYGNGLGGYGAPVGPGFGYNPGIPPQNANAYGYGGYPPQGNHGHSMSILKAFDRDGDGNITENDFVIAARQFGLGFLGESIARNTFRKFDKNRNGRLEMSEAFGAIGTLKGMGGHKHY